MVKKIDFRNPGEGFILKIFKWENPGEENEGEGFSNYYTGSKDRADIFICILTSPGQEIGHTTRETSHLKLAITQAFSIVDRNSDRSQQPQRLVVTVGRR